MLAITAVHVSCYYCAHSHLNLLYQVIWNFLLMTGIWLIRLTIWLFLGRLRELETEVRVSRLQLESLCVSCLSANRRGWQWLPHGHRDVPRADEPHNQ